MELSVLMPVYDETDVELKQSIYSVLSQSNKNFNLIIIDDNPSSRRVKRLLVKISAIDNRIRLIFNQKSIGPSKSVNKGVLQSSSPFIARMDADDICESDRLQKQINFIQKYDLDLICSNFRGFYNENNISDPYYGNKDLTNQNIIRKILSYSNIAMGPTLFFKRRAFIKIKGYRNLLSEDYDLATRFIINGYKVGYQSSVLLFKRNRRNNLSSGHGLDEFISTYLISKVVRKTSYQKQLSLNQLQNALSDITKWDKFIFKEFKYNFNKYKLNNSLWHLINAIFISFFSLLVLKRNLWMFFINHNNNHKV